VCNCWKKVEAAFACPEELRRYYSHLFKNISTLFQGGVQNDGEEVETSSEKEVSALSSAWSVLKEVLKQRDNSVGIREGELVQDCEEGLRSLSEHAALYDALQQYPGPVDSKDDDPHFGGHHVQRPRHRVKRR
jgi:hypothetical protein